jgi:AcrR family transcriptional regulator
MAKVKAGVPTRDRILHATADLLRRQGYSGTGLKQIVKAADAPFGSVYHFFPRGKEQLGAEAIRVSGRAYNALVAASFSGKSDLVAATKAFFEGAAEVLVASDYQDACPIATVALEVASESEPMRKATAEIFESWIADASRCFEEARMRPKDARTLAIRLFMLLEGAFILCRSWKSTEPMAIAGRWAVQAAAAAVGPPGRAERVGVGRHGPRR